MDNQIVVYKASDGNELAVKTDGETVWMTQEQMCLLFGRTQPVIARHIANVFKEGELPKEGFMQILHKTSTAGGRPTEPPRRRIGFNADPEPPTKPYGKLRG